VEEEEDDEEVNDEEEVDDVVVAVEGSISERRRLTKRILARLSDSVAGAADAGWDCTG
jgi:hypothetical protein